VNEVQYGGTHYKSEFQHWDLIVLYNVGYLEGNVTKYLTRWKDKNGLEDLKKAKHYIEKIISVRDGNGSYPLTWHVPTKILELYFAINEVDDEHVQKVFFSLLQRPALGGGSFDGADIALRYVNAVIKKING